MRSNKRQGSLLLEALIATALLSIFISAAAGLLLSANQGISASYTSERARWVVEGALSALRSVSFDQLLPLASATLNYHAGSSQWLLASGEPEEIGHGLTRTISVEEVFRNAECEVVAEGGESDPDSRYIASTVSWNLPNGQNRTYESRSLRVNWDDPEGDCFNTIQATFVTLHVSGAIWGGTKQLRDVFINNETSQDATVTHITIYWDYPDSLAQQMFIGSGKVWTDSGPGSPSGSQPSGTRIDVQDFVIPANSEGEAYKVQFTQSMGGSTIDIHFEFEDGSIFETGPFVPQ